MSGSFGSSDYTEYPKTLAPEDFWGQVRRTVNGKPVDEAQIQMIVDAVIEALDLGGGDEVLDLCCGNGALSQYLFARCTALFGVDISPYLIEVAKAHFERPPTYVFDLADVVAYLTDEADPARFTKALCYGSFSFLPVDRAEAVLAGLRVRFTGLQRLLIGNLPDRDAAAAFYARREVVGADLDDPESGIGIWRSMDQMAELCAATGWRVEFSRMPPEFSAAFYRYDALLLPA